MRTILKSALVALALSAGLVSMNGPATARAAVGIAFDFGNIAFAYSDGYWDRDHHWHAWRNREEAREYRERYHEHYFDRRHDARDYRDNDRNDYRNGWRDNDRWWERR